MDCSEAREHLFDLGRGRLEIALAEAVRAHVSQCPGCGAALEVETRIRALVQAQASRYTAPPELRRRIQALLVESAASTAPQASVTHDADSGARRTGGTRWRDWLRGHPWTVGSLAGAVAALVLVWAGSLWMARDSISLLAARAVAEHAEYVKATMTHPAADPATVVGEVRRQVDFAIGPVFPGDSQVQMVTGRASDLPGKRAATFIYRDGSGRYTTFFLMPEAGTDIPAEGRMSIETFTPYHRVISGRQLLLWKQRGLACLLVSDLDEAGMAQMFLKIRQAT